MTSTASTPSFFNGWINIVEVVTWLIFRLFKQKATWVLQVFKSSWLLNDSSLSAIGEEPDLSQMSQF